MNGGLRSVLDRSSIVIVTSLWTTARLITLVRPAALFIVSTNVFVPGASGKRSTHNSPLRSTRPLASLVRPLVSVICAVTVAVGSSSRPRRVKLLPLTCAPSCGQYSVRAGGLVTPE